MCWYHECVYSRAVKRLNTMLQLPGTEKTQHQPTNSICRENERRRVCQSKASAAWSFRGRSPWAPLNSPCLGSWARVSVLCFEEICSLSCRLAILFSSDACVWYWPRGHLILKSSVKRKVAQKNSVAMEGWLLAAEMLKPEEVVDLGEMSVL